LGTISWTLPLTYRSIWAELGEQSLCVFVHLPLSLCVDLIVDLLYI